ncbi:hypothetical protein [Pelotomaculum sp. FP]|uniref:hypothetical protein n=1 Tax=Pelotomaculum sp. FP TaxID=261474 RepID=UPI0018652D21|nr:hypothetical protein [Pelotomaculum sp. FP]
MIEGAIHSHLQRNHVYSVALEQFMALTGNGKGLVISKANRSTIATLSPAAATCGRLAG